MVAIMRADRDCAFAQSALSSAETARANAMAERVLTLRVLDPIPPQYMSLVPTVLVVAHTYIYINEMYIIT